jgi:hypothetical protein
MTKTCALGAALLALAPPGAFAQANPRGEVKLTLVGKAVTIEYGRPSLKGRDMLARAEIGKPWRMGADGATTLVTESDLAFGKAVVPKGSYVLKATKVAEGEWKLNVLTAEQAAIADVPLAVQDLTESVEMLTIELAATKGGGQFALKWGTKALTADFTAK